MSDGAAIKTAKGCLERAVSIKTTAERLWNAGDEWFAVCYFYAAYHTVKAAFIEDPVFDNLGELQNVNKFLILNDRFATRHHGYVSGGSRVMGVNDIVKELYPQVAVEYVRLHMASIAVRYGTGLGVIAPDSVIRDYETVIGAYTRGELRV